MLSKQFIFLAVYNDDEISDNLKKKLINPTKDVEIIFIMTEKQKAMYEEYPTVLMIDGTHGTNSSNFILVSGLILDSRGEGYPIFQAFVQSESRLAFETIFEILSKISPETIIRVKTIVSDMSKAFKTALHTSLSHNFRHVMCAFHLIQC